MKNFKMLFLDIDGTTLRPDDTIESSTKEAISILREKGIETVLATGRPIHEIKEIGEELDIKSYIGYNGALAIYRGEHVFSSPMADESVRAILETMRKNEHEAVLYTDSKNLFTHPDSPATKDFAQKFNLRRNEAFDEQFMGDILGMTIIAKGNNGAEIYQKEPRMHFSQVNVDGMRHSLDVIRDNINKGTGIKFLLDRLGIDREQTIAFGDGMNDKEMLSYVGVGFAMGNSLPDLFAYADRRTTSVTDSGIYNGLKSLGLLDR
ncbi:Cof-type HAD-IIB family hydrolase [Mesobacillus zeae]|uniref:HAD family phosphatase n=1 Tax=Mesobacillus zeae TaxID=1917180 RepID=A0A398BDL4_9BACI|nr:HAD family hydrolase [Mesobacillus zeae]RID85840.1 HAD family phosphatase [Mesobacillus zeae]